MAEKAVQGSEAESWKVLALVLGLRMEVLVVLKQERVKDSRHVLTKCQSPDFYLLLSFHFPSFTRSWTAMDIILYK